jgi:MFS family permease
MFRRYYLASGASVQALWAQRVVLGWLAWEISHAPSYVGIVAALSMAPTLISGPVFGVLVDRADILRAARWSTLAMSGILVLAALWHIAVGLGLWTLALVALIVGVISSAHHPVRMSLAPRLVPPDQVGRVVALTALNFNLARLIAPVWAGLALTWTGAEWTLLAGALLYLPMLFVLPGLVARPLRVRTQTPAILVALGQGVGLVWRNALVFQAIMLTAVFAVLVRGYLEVLPILAEGVHGRGPAGLGALTAAAGAGAVVAAGAKTLGLGGRTDQIPWVLRVVLVLGVGSIAIIGAVPSWGVALAMTVALGFASTYCGVSLQAVVQSNLDDDFRGRVMSLWVVVGFGSVALGALILGALAELVGFSTTLMWVGGVGAVIMGGLVLRPGR